MLPSRRSTWVFAHGSLMFRPGVEVLATRPFRVAGLVRRFGHPSVRNWGRPGWPAPTSCLVPGDRVDGLVLAVSPADLDALCRREASTPVQVVGETPDGRAVGALTWTMTTPWAESTKTDLATLAAENVRKGGGPFGDAYDYALGVVSSLERHGLEDLFATRYLAALGAAVTGGAEGPR